MWTNNRKGCHVRQTNGKPVKLDHIYIFSPLAHRNMIKNSKNRPHGASMYGVQLNGHKNVNQDEIERIYS